MKDKEEKKNEKNYRVIFINTYIGDLGIFYKNKTYELTKEQYKLFKNDCKEIE